MIGVAIIGPGFMGRTHAAAYAAAAAAGFPCRLAGFCGAPSLGAVSAALDPIFCDPGVRDYGTPERLLADPGIHLVSICTYTETHADLAVAALEAGKHVLVEKPVALRTDDVRRVADAAARAKTLCMPAMCMRFWPGWDWLHDRVRDGRHGALLSLTFRRMGAEPPWARDFYLDDSRSGGALTDLHIHDVDFIHWCLGGPESLVSAGSLNHVTTLYRYGGGPRHVAAEGAWTPVAGTPFRMRYTAVFEHAVADFDLARESRLLLTDGGRTGPVHLDPLTGYDWEVRHLLAAILECRTDLRATMQDAVAVAAILDAERRSLASGAPRHLGDSTP